MTTELQATNTTAKQPLMRLPKRVAGSLAVVILLGTLLRLVGLGWSLPDNRHPYATYHPDERINLNAALQADVSHLKFDIGFYNYGAFYFYLANVSHIVGRAYGIIPVPPNNAENIMPFRAKENAGLFFMGRLVTALMGIATIPVVFGIGRRFYNDNVGLFAAFLYTVAPLAVIHAHFLTVDVPATLFVALALLYAARLLEKVTTRDLILAGIWTGLAAATKYNAVLVGIAPLVALYLTPQPPLPTVRSSLGEGESQNKILPSPQRGTSDQGRGVGGEGKKWKSLGILLASVVLTFLIACPGVWLNFDAFWNGIPNYPGSGVRYELFEHSCEGHGELFLQTGIGVWYHLVISLRQGLSLPFLLLFLVGIGVAFKRRTPADRVLLIFFFVSYLLYSLSAVRFARYMIPLFPGISVLAARTLLEPGTVGKWLRGFAIIAGIIASIISYFFVQVMQGKDPRDAAADWMERNAKPGATVAFGRIPWFTSPPLNPRFGLPAAPQRAEAVNDTSRYNFRIPEKEWDQSVLTPAPDYIIVSNLEFMHPVRLENAAAISFLNAARRDRSVHDFASGLFILLTLHQSLLSEDILYVLPEVTIYEKSSR